MNKTTQYSRFVALLLTIGYILSLSVAALEQDGPDKITPGTPEMSCVRDWFYYTPQLALGSNNNKWECAVDGWCDASVWQTGEFGPNHFFEYGFPGGDYSTTYRAVFEIVSNVTPETATLEGLEGNNYSGITRTECSSNSWSGESSAMEYEYCFYSW